MQAVVEIVLRQLDGITVQCETTLIDTVCIASDRSTKVAGYINIVSNAVKTLNYILHLTVLIGYHDRHDTSSEVSDAYFHTCLVL